MTLIRNYFIPLKCRAEIRFRLAERAENRPDRALCVRHDLRAAF